MTEPEKLPKNLQAEWLREQAAAGVRAETERKAAEAAAREEATARAEAEARKAAQLKQIEEDSQRQQRVKRNQSISELKMADTYPGLDAYINFLQFALGCCLVGGFLLIFGGFICLSGESEVAPQVTTALFTYGIVTVVVGSITTWGMIEFVRLAKNVARDAKISRELLTRLTYPPETPESAPQPPSPHPGGELR